MLDLLRLRDAAAGGVLVVGFVRGQQTKQTTVEGHPCVISESAAAAAEFKTVRLADPGVPPVHELTTSPGREYRWSSWPEYLRSPGKRPGWLRVDRVLGEGGLARDSAAGRRELERTLELRRGAEREEGYRAIRRGWFFGERALKKELLGQMSERMGSEHYEEERAESQAEKADRVVREELRRRGWTEATLGQKAKGDAEKVKVAVRLRKETAVKVAWIAERLQMGSVANVNTLLYQWRQSQHKKSLFIRTDPFLRNACDAALETGGGVNIRWAKIGSQWEVCLEDEGPGLSNTANLFVPFFTTKPGGSGIGLVISRPIAEAQGGSLLIENRKDRPGCIAGLRLPMD